MLRVIDWYADSLFFFQYFTPTRSRMHAHTHAHTLIVSPSPPLPPSTHSLSYIHVQCLSLHRLHRNDQHRILHQLAGVRQQPKRSQCQKGATKFLFLILFIYYFFFFALFVLILLPVLLLLLLFNLIVFYTFTINLCLYVVFHLLIANSFI